MGNQTKEAKQVEVLGFNVYPYADLRYVKGSLVYAQDHFKETFEIRKLEEGYILANQTRILDARGFCVDSKSPLEGGVEAFDEIRNLSSLVEQ